MSYSRSRKFCAFLSRHQYFHKMELQGGGRGVGPGGGSIIRGNGLGTSTSSTSLTHLLCSEDGLIPCLEMLFQSGLKSSRIPMRKVTYIFGGRQPFFEFFFLLAGLEFEYYLEIFSLSSCVRGLLCIPDSSFVCPLG